MTLYDWIFSNYPPDSAINGRWGTLHICVVACCVLLILVIASFRKRDEKTRKTVLLVLAGVILVLEIARRVINLCRGVSDFDHLVYILVPRPWCAISCWMTIAAAFSKKKVLYQFSAVISLLCALVFFAWPSVGFNDRVILFENFYSITTHSLLLVSSVSMLTLGAADFAWDRKMMGQTLMLTAGIYVYAAAEILLGIEKDPLYFMPGNDVQAFLGVEYPLFLVIYIGFLILWFCGFFGIPNWIRKKKKAASSC